MDLTKRITELEQELARSNMKLEKLIESFEDLDDICTEEVHIYSCSVCECDFFDTEQNGSYYTCELCNEEVCKTCAVKIVPCVCGHCDGVDPRGSHQITGFCPTCAIICPNCGTIDPSCYDMYGDEERCPKCGLDIET